MEEFIKLHTTRPETEQSWNLKAADIDEETCDLSVKNPNTPEEAPLRKPQEILDEMETLDIEINTLLKSIRELI